MIKEWWKWWNEGQSECWERGSFVVLLVMNALAWSWMVG